MLGPLSIKQVDKLGSVKHVDKEYKMNDTINKFLLAGNKCILLENDKACLQHSMAYGDFQDRRTASDELLCDKAFNIAKNPKYDEYQRALASMVYKCFDKNTAGGAAENGNM